MCSREARAASGGKLQRPCKAAAAPCMQKSVGRRPPSRAGVPPSNPHLPLPPDTVCSGCYEFSGTNIGISPSILKKDLKKSMLKACSHNGGRSANLDSSPCMLHAECHAERCSALLAGCPRPALQRLVGLFFSVQTLQMPAPHLLQLISRD